ncbi:GNAT family N-acetyltransferase [Vibrio nereis]|uniref:GNAT family N-acetyltransferase n=1 Tax=Vibrio nereis TaxID=693 RepID=UPI002495964E|nr:GNAT family N-acetyltransferase [Vibrio nereis]
MMETKRLIIREWKPEDYAPYGELTADPHVMRFFPETLSKQQSDDQLDLMRRLIAERGWGFWAVETKDTAQFIGFVGLHYQDENSGIPNAPFVEIGWRLASEFWGLGYAPEAANKVLDFAFNTLDQPDVYAFTALVNAPSQRVMAKLGMVNTNQDFNHPKLVSGHPLERHCLYRITKAQFCSKDRYANRT